MKVKFSMKIIIAGNGKLGDTLIKQLSKEGHDVTVIDSSKQVLESSIEQFDVMTVYGNCATRDVLIQAEVKSSDLLIAVTGMDEVNLLTCMTAHGINPNIHTIARIRNPDYTQQIYEMKNVFDISLAVNPELQTATEIERLLKYPGFLKRDTFAKGRIELVELRIDKDSKLCDVPLSQLDSIVNCKVLVCVVLRDGKALIPSGDFILKEGDCIFVTASSKVLTLLLKNLNIITKKTKRVTLCGGGKITYYLARLLVRDGISVQIVDNNLSRCKELADLLPECNIIHGDASNETLLESEGVDTSDAVVSLTGLDELNIIISLYSKSKNISQVITKLSRLNQLGIIDSLLGSYVCPKELCCNNIVRYVRAMKNQTGAAISVHGIANGQAEALEFKANEQTRNCGVPLRSIKLKNNILLACITKKGVVEIPNGDSTFDVGDTIIVVTTGNQVIDRLNDIFE